MRNKSIIAVLLILVVVALLLELRLGKFEISSSQFLDYLSFKKLDTTASIIMESRFYRSCTAMFAGCGLALAGLLMQTYFRNALAGPSVLGISSGASFAVAIALMFAGTGLSFSSDYASRGLIISLSAVVGSGAVLLLISFLSRYLKSSVSLLILGLMIGYLTSALVGLLQFNASETSLKAFVVWGLGSFSDTNGMGVLFLLGAVFLGLIMLAFIFKHLNVMLMGEAYAESMGIEVGKVKIVMILITGIIVGVVTAFCGPIAFLGLAIPHLARALFKSSDHKILVPGVILVGILLGLTCDLISRAPWYDGGVPLNTVTSLIGAPIIIYYLLRRSKTGDYI